MITIKVKPETYRKLKMYQAQLVLSSGGEDTYSMDDVINALIYLLEHAKIKFVKPKTTEVQGSPSSLE
ncbi:MAG: hypothetical protein QXH03_02820 [Candidatus Bathyarchaeia archaeon]